VIENPSKSEVIGRSGGDEKPQITTQNRQKSRMLKKNKLNNNTRVNLSIAMLHMYMSAARDIEE